MLFLLSLLISNSSSQPRLQCVSWEFFPSSLSCLLPPCFHSIVYKLSIIALITTSCTTHFGACLLLSLLKMVLSTERMLNFYLWKKCTKWWLDRWLAGWLSQYLQFPDRLLTSPSLPFQQRLLLWLSLSLEDFQCHSLTLLNLSSLNVLSPPCGFLITPNPSPPYSLWPTCCFLIALFCTGTLTDTYNLKGLAGHLFGSFLLNLQNWYLASHLPASFLVRPTQAV